MQQARHDRVLVEPGPIENPGHREGMLHIGYSTAAASLSGMSDCGQPQSLLHIQAHEIC